MISKIDIYQLLTSLGFEVVQLGHKVVGEYPDGETKRYLKRDYGAEVLGCQVIWHEES